MPYTPGQGMPGEVQQCIKDCTECGSVCQQTINYCLQMGGRHVEQSHLRLMMDCAEICQTSQNYMLRSSDYAAHLCRVCADVCRDCADSCSQFAGDTLMQDCAEVCRGCAASCQRMVASMREKVPSAV